MPSFAIAFSALTILILFSFVPVASGGNLILPFASAPVDIKDGWFYHAGSRHRAVDYYLPTGHPIVAAADGIAMASCQDTRKNPGICPDGPVADDDVYGRFVFIRHSDGTSTLYAHLASYGPRFTKIYPPAERGNINFNEWISVRQGEVIGFAGNSGSNITAAKIHLHFEVALNPTGDYSGHYQGKRDPYRIWDTFSFYPPSERFTACGSDFDWKSCPPGVLPTHILFPIAGTANSFQGFGRTGKDVGQTILSSDIVAGNITAITLGLGRVGNPSDSVRVSLRTTLTGPEVGVGTIPFSELPAQTPTASNFSIVTIQISPVPPATSVPSSSIGVVYLSRTGARSDTDFGYSIQATTNPYLNGGYFECSPGGSPEAPPASCNDGNAPSYDHIMTLLGE